MLFWYSHAAGEDCQNRKIESLRGHSAQLEEKSTAILRDFGPTWCWFSHLSRGCYLSSIERFSDVCGCSLINNRSQPSAIRIWHVYVRTNNRRPGLIPESRGIINQHMPGRLTFERQVMSACWTEHELRFTNPKMFRILEIRGMVLELIWFGLHLSSKACSGWICFRNDWISNRSWVRWGIEGSDFQHIWSYLIINIPSQSTKGI